MRLDWLVLRLLEVVVNDPVVLVLLSVNTFVEVEVELPVLVRFVWLVLLLLEVVVNDPVVLVLLSVNTSVGSQIKAPSAGAACLARAAAARRRSE